MNISGVNQSNMRGRPSVNSPPSRASGIYFPAPPKKTHPPDYGGNHTKPAFGSYYYHPYSYHPYSKLEEGSLVDTLTKLILGLLPGNRELKKLEKDVRKNIKEVKQTTTIILKNTPSQKGMTLNQIG